LPLSLLLRRRRRRRTLVQQLSTFARCTVARSRTRVVDARAATLALVPISSGAQLTPICSLLDTLHHNDGAQAHVMQQLNTFAEDGLRTLLLARRHLAAEQYDAWAETYRLATIAIEGRPEKIAEAAALVGQVFMFFCGKLYNI
jgi:hypothetical protein